MILCLRKVDPNKPKKPQLQTWRNKKMTESPISIDKNPLLNPSKLEDAAVPFDLIRAEHFLPAVDEAIRQGRKNIEKIKQNGQSPDFKNTLLALETSSELLELVSSTYFNLYSAHADEEFQKLAQIISPKLTEFQNDVSLDEVIFSKIAVIYENRDSLELDQEERRLVELTYTDFVCNGAKLDATGKKQLRVIDQALSKLSPQFSTNLLKATNAFEFIVSASDEDGLEGIPETVLESAKIAALDKGYPQNWLFNLEAPSYVPFLTYCKNSEWRKTMWMAYNKRCIGDEYDNRKILLEMARLRHQRAQLLGFETHAAFKLKKRMAETPQEITRFLQRLVAAAKPKALKELLAVQEIADELGGPNPVMPWDVAYYSTQLKQKLFGLDDEQLRPYFKLESVIDGAFEHARLLYGLRFEPIEHLPTYHQDVKVYRVIDGKNEKYLGLFYTDFFPRPTKKGGAWATTFREQGLRQLTGAEPVIGRPHVSIVCNFTKSTPTKPSLLTIEEVLTLFHEFGHSLHSLLSECRFQSLAGTNVFWDFVELPSQIMENWVRQKQSLDLFARHYETGEPMPEELIAKINQSATFQAGLMTLRQVSLALIDWSWHTATGAFPKENEIEEFEAQVTSETNILPRPKGTAQSTSFAHIFSGGYSAGYYSYKWAEVLDADAFELFKEQGLFSPKVAEKFRRHILSRGGTEHPRELYRRFRGRDPDPDALLRRDQLV